MAMRNLLFSLCFVLMSPGVIVAKDQKIAAVVENGYWKIIDYSGNTISDSIDKYQPQYYTNAFITEGICLIKHDGRYGFKTYTNQWVAPCVFTGVRNFANGFAAVCNNGKWGAINKAGKYIVDTLYDYVSDATEEGVFVVRKGDTLACFDSSGKMIVPFYYLATGGLFPEPVFSDGLLRVMVADKNGNHFEGQPCYKIGFIDTHGKLAIDTVYSLIYAMRDSHEDIMRAMRNGEICSTGMHNLSKSGAMEQHNWYINGDFYRFEGGRCLVMKKGAPLVINTRGEAIFSLPQVGYKTVNTNGYFIVNDGMGMQWYDKINYGLYNPDGKQILPIKYGPISGLHDGLFSVRIAHGYVYNEEAQSPRELSMYADTYGKFTIRDTFDIADDFAGGVARVSVYKQKNGYGHINTSGRFLSFDKEKIWIMASGAGEWPIGVKEHKYGYLDGKFKWAIEPVYEDAQGFSLGVAAVKINGKWGYINKKEKMVIPAKYDVAGAFQAMAE